LCRDLVKRFFCFIFAKMTSYDDFYPWASLPLRRETSSFTSDNFIVRFRHEQPLCQSDEEDVLVVRCELDEPVCANESSDHSGPFCFFYATLFSKVGMPHTRAISSELVYWADLRPIYEGYLFSKPHHLPSW